MKKALAALLASFVGLFGYQIADKALEERVSDLESSVSSLADQMNSQQYDADDDTTYQIPTLPPAPTLPTQPISIGTKQEYSGHKKFLLREYTDGEIVYISPFNSDSINEIKVESTNKTVNENKAKTTPVLDSAIYIALTTGPVGRSYTNDYYLYITDASRTIIDIDDKITVVYDEDYNTQTQVYGKEFTVKYNIKGMTDKALSGKEILFFTQDHALLKTIINSDGTFDFSNEIIQNQLNYSFFFDSK